MSSKSSRPSNNRPSKVVNKSLLSPHRIKVCIEYLPNFDNQPTIIIRLSDDVIFSKNRRIFLSENGQKSSNRPG